MDTLWGLMVKEAIAQEVPMKRLVLALAFLLLPAAAQAHRHHGWRHRRHYWRHGSVTVYAPAPPPPRRVVVVHPVVPPPPPPHVYVVP
jgi:hypothetical protein